jgi:hypothetical protein
VNNGEDRFRRTAPTFEAKKLRAKDMFRVRAATQAT